MVRPILRWGKIPRRHHPRTVGGVTLYLFAIWSIVNLGSISLPLYIADLEIKSPLSVRLWVYLFCPVIRGPQASAVIPREKAKELVNAKCRYL